MNTLYYGKDLDGTPFDPIVNLTKSFGGPLRAARIKGFLHRLRSKGGNIKIVSTSWAPVTEEQWKAYLINITSPFDLGFDENTTLSLEDPGPGLSADKGKWSSFDSTISSYTVTFSEKGK